MFAMTVTDEETRRLLQHGVVNLDKPSGPTSHQVAAWVRGITGVNKASHTGTLDPGVTGCLPILLGRSARVSGLFRDLPKSYVFVLQLHGDAPDVESVFREFRGEVYQRPPVKSSVKRRVRKRVIYELDVLEREGRRVLGTVRCEAGTYVRKLCHDIGLALGVGAHMQELRRTSTGMFRVEDAVYLQDLADAFAMDDGEAVRELVIPIEDCLEDYPSITVKDSAVDAIAHGAPLYRPGVVEMEAEITDTALVFSSSGDLVCVGEVVDEGDVVLEPNSVLIEPGEYPDRY